MGFSQSTQQDLEAQSTSPSSQKQVVHESRFQLAPFSCSSPLSSHSVLAGMKTAMGSMDSDGHEGQHSPGRCTGFSQSGSTQDTEEQSGSPASQVQVTHESLFQVSPSL